MHGHLNVTLITIYQTTQRHVPERSQSTFSLLQKLIFHWKLYNLCDIPLTMINLVTF